MESSCPKLLHFLLTRQRIVVLGQDLTDSDMAKSFLKERVSTGAELMLLDNQENRSQLVARMMDQPQMEIERPNPKTATNLVVLKDSPTGLSKSSQQTRLPGFNPTIPPGDLPLRMDILH